MKQRKLAGLKDEELLALLKRREIADAEITDEQMVMLIRRMDELGLERIDRDLNLDGEIICLHPYWRISRPNT